MIDAGALPSPRHLLTAAVIGLYAAAIALAPNLTTALVLSAPLILIPLAWWILLTPSRWLALFFFAALLLPPLPIPIGNSGPHPALLFAAAGLFIGMLRRTEWTGPRDSLSGALALFFSVLLASVALAAFYSGPEIATGSLVRVILFGISLYVFFYTAHGPASLAAGGSFRAVRLLFWTAAASALFACLDFYFQFPAPAGYGDQFVWLETGVFRRAQGIFYEASTLGNFCAFFLVMVAVSLFRPRAESPLPRWALLLGGSVLSAALVFSYSRASLLNLAAAFVALLWLHRDRFRFRKLIPALLICVAAGAAITYTLFPAFAQLYWLRWWISGQYLFSETGGILSGRLESWRTLGNFLLDKPWHALLGVGYKTLPYSDFIGRITIPDNMYLSLLVETGIVGLAALIWFNAAILRASYRAAMRPIARASFFGSWIFCFWIGQLVQMMSGDLLTYWRVLPVYFWVLALAVREA